MRKLLSLLIMLAIMILPASAMAAPGDAILLKQGVDGFDDSLAGLAELNGTVYILTNNRIYTMAMDETKPVPHELELNEGLEAEPDDADDDVTVNKSRDAHSVIVYDGRVCLIVSDSTTETYGTGEDMESTRTVDGVWLYELTFDEDGKVALGEEIVELDWRDIYQSGGDYEYIPNVDMPFVMDHTLYFTTYDDSGNTLIMATDLEDGSSESFQTGGLFSDRSINSLCAYKDGKILCSVVEWGEEEPAIKLYAVNLEEEEVEELVQLPSVGYSYASGLVYRQENDTLYYVMNGEIHTMTGMDVSTIQSVAAIPLDSVYAGAPIVTEDGLYIAGNYDTVVRRNTDPSLRSESKLTVQNAYNQSIDNAYYAFTNQHGDVEVVMVQQVEDIVQAMMNRSSSVDIYCLSVSTSDYDAVFSRGYMAELSGSEKLKAFMESCYPWVQSVCVKDGELVCIPVELYISGGCGYSIKAFERLGLGQEDVPTTWAEFFRSLKPLADKVAEIPGMSLFEPYYDRESVRYSLFSSMFSSYTAYISQPGNDFSYDTPMFREILEAFESVPWDQLGLSDPNTDDGMGAVAVSAGVDEESKVLYSIYYNLSADSYRVRDTMQWLQLGLGEGAEPLAQGDMYVAFVNPFSQNREAAVAFMETIVDEMQALLKTHVSPENNEPVKSAYYESNLESYDEMIATARQELEQADEDEKEAYEEILAQYEQYREEFLEYGAWEISEQSIEHYRSNADKIVVVRNIGLSGENADEFYTIRQQYMDGAIGANELITGIDRKLQMMIKEGM